MSASAPAAPDSTPTVLGEPPLNPPERAGRFEEFVDALDLLLREPMTSYAGNYYTVVDSRTLPGCTQMPRPPFAVAATGPPRARRCSALRRHVGDERDPPGPSPGRSRGSPACRSRSSSSRRRTPRRDARHRFAAPPSSASASPGRSRRSSAWDELCERLQGLGFTDVIVHWPRSGGPGPARAGA